MRQKKVESANLASSSKGIKKRKSKGTSDIQANKMQESKDIKCFSCMDPSYVRKDSPTYHTCRVKKCIHLILVCKEVNLASMPRYTWCLDSGATINISSSIQGC